MTDEPKPTLDQVRASVRDALRKLTGAPDLEPEVVPPVSKAASRKGSKAKRAPE